MVTMTVIPAAPGWRIGHPDLHHVDWPIVAWKVEGPALHPYAVMMETGNVPTLITGDTIIKSNYVIIPPDPA